MHPANAEDRHARRDRGHHLTRRTFLSVAGLAGATLVATRVIQKDVIGGLEQRASRWSEATTWSHLRPGQGDVVLITRPVLLDTDARVSGIEIAAGGALIFEPGRTTYLRSSGNVVVHGRLRMRPSRAEFVHHLIFEDVEEDRFVGSGNRVLDSDVGLWVMGRGRLDAGGSPKAPWLWLDGAADRGSTTLSLASDPVGWRVGDDLIVTPTLEATAQGFSAAHDEVVVKAIDGRVITLSAPLRSDHPEVAFGGERSRTAEVLNLSRNVSIEGTPRGRSHVFIRSSVPQNIANLRIRYMGPRHAERSGTSLVTGRYGLHFHECFDRSRGSLVEGVVVRDSGSHAFVPHHSDGVTFRGCVSHDTFEDAFWWDDEHHSDDTLFADCVASYVRSDPAFRGYTLSGFVLGGGMGNTARGCVAVGVQGTRTSSGYHWPSKRLSDGTWGFQQCLAHNNNANGIYVWQNSPRSHVIEDFVGYHNGRTGVLHGAYRNHYRYRGCQLIANRGSAMELWANADEEGIELADMTFDAGGFSDYAVLTGDRIAEPQARTRFLRCSFRRYRKAGFGVLSDRSVDPRHAMPEADDFIDCTWDATEFWLAPRIDPRSVIRVQDPRHGSISLQRRDGSGSVMRSWDAAVNRIAPFA